MSNEPVLLNGIVGIILAVLTPILVHYGYDSDSVAAAAAAVVTAVGSILALFRARSKVTPGDWTSYVEPVEPDHA